LEFPLSLIKEIGMIGHQPLIVSYGAGRDSTALLIEMHRRGMRPDAIVFANVGSEKRASYDFIPVFHQWLLDHGFPASPRSPTGPAGPRTTPSKAT
jgi:hypothetical protein